MNWATKDSPREAASLKAPGASTRCTVPATVRARAAVMATDRRVIDIEDFASDRPSEPWQGTCRTGCERMDEKHQSAGRPRPRGHAQLALRCLTGGGSASQTPALDVTTASSEAQADAALPGGTGLDGFVRDDRLGAARPAPRAADTDRGDCGFSIARSPAAAVPPARRDHDDASTHHRRRQHGPRHRAPRSRARGDEVVAMRRPGPARPEPATTSARVDVAFEFSHAAALLRQRGPGARGGLPSPRHRHDRLDRRRRRPAQRLRQRAWRRPMRAPSWRPRSASPPSSSPSWPSRPPDCFGRFPDYDPYVFEQHRRTKPDRPSGTALAVAERLLPHLPSKREARLAEGSGAPDPDVLEVVALRAGSHPGMHIVGFDGPGEALELRITARDRSAYVAGALLAADWLAGADPDRPGMTDFTLARPRARTAPETTEMTDLTTTTPRRPRTTDTEPTDDRPADPARCLHRPGHAVHPRRRARRDRARRDSCATSSRPASTASCPVGTTGEAPTLDTAERERVIELTVPGRPRPRRRPAAYRVVAGTGTNDTRATIAATRRAAALGADAALVVAPYYNKPDQRMLEAHYRAIADEGDLPVVVYNVPGRTGVNVGADTLLRLAEHERIIGRQGGLRGPRADHDHRARPAGRASPSSPATTAGPARCWRSAATASSRSPPTRCPGVMAELCAAARAGDWPTARRSTSATCPSCASTS